MTDLVDIDDTVIGALDAMTVVIPRRSNATTTASITSLGTGRPARLSLAGHRGAVLELADGVLTLGGGPLPPNTGGADGAQLLRHQRPRPRGRPAARHRMGRPPPALAAGHSPRRCRRPHDATSRRRPAALVVGAARSPVPLGLLEEVLPGRGDPGRGRAGLLPTTRA